MKRILALILILTMALALTGCGAAATTAGAAETQAAATTAAAAESKTVNIGVLVWKFSDAYGSTVRLAIEKYAKEVGDAQGVTVNLDMQDANDNQTTQNDQCDTLLAKGIDLLIINLATDGAAQALIDKAAAKGVPVLFYNKEPTDSKTLVPAAKSLFIGTKPEEAGVMQGEIFAEQWAANAAWDKNGDGVCQYLMFKGQADNIEAIARTKYSIDTAVAKGVKMELASSDIYVCDWDTAKAQDTMTAAWASVGSKVEAIFTNNDGMAIGVIAALNQVSFNSGDKAKNYIPVYGVDATDEAAAAISAGKMAGTVKQDGDAMGKAVVTIAVNGALDKGWLDGTSYEMAADGYSVRIPYAKIQ
ncbi:MAG: galactose ABC transporter substrate-binding protein [Eubacteriales bacterium]|nr:galactose ABC transporter substrate-binding protein [Eubacteriales bacterium]